MIFIDERKLQTLLVATEVTKEVLLQRIARVIEEKGDKQALCSLWYDNGGVKCTYCGEGAFDGTGPHACSEINAEDEHERVEFYQQLRDELQRQLPATVSGPKRINLPLYMALEGQVTEPDGLVDMLTEGGLKKCWYKEHWNCCEGCAKVYFQGAGEEGQRSQICLSRPKEELRELKIELERWLTG
jgi:hypothetical protein